MEPIMILVGILVLLGLFFIFRSPAKSVRVIGTGVIRLTIGVLFLFFLNVFGGAIGLHIPINIFTVIISSILGLFGVTSLAAIHIFIL